MEITQLLPPEIGPWFAALLIASSFLTSALTAAMGLGGGVALLAIMGLGMPAASMLPVHGIVQLGSNLGRTVIQHRYVLWSCIGWFTLGSVAGVALGTPVALHIPDGIAKMALALFILWSVFHRRQQAKPASRAFLVLGGALTSLGSMVVGATGPLVAGLLSAQGLIKQRLIATHATCMVMQHGLKIIAFGLAGFAYAGWLPMLAAMIASGVLGTWLGSSLLENMPEQRFRLIFRVTMLLLCVQLFWQGLLGLRA